MTQTPRRWCAVTPDGWADARDPENPAIHKPIVDEHPYSMQAGYGKDDLQEEIFWAEQKLKGFRVVTRGVLQGDQVLDVTGVTLKALAVPYDEAWNWAFGWATQFTATWHYDEAGVKKQLKVKRSSVAPPCNPNLTVRRQLEDLDPEVRLAWTRLRLLKDELARRRRRPRAVVEPQGFCFGPHATTPRGTWHVPSTEHIHVPYLTDVMRDVVAQSLALGVPEAAVQDERWVAMRDEAHERYLVAMDEAKGESNLAVYDEDANSRPRTSAFVKKDSDEEIDVWSIDDATEAEERIAALRKRVKQKDGTWKKGESSLAAHEQVARDMAEDPLLEQHRSVSDDIHDNLARLNYADATEHPMTEEEKREQWMRVASVYGALHRFASHMASMPVSTFVDEHGRNYEQLDGLGRDEVPDRDWDGIVSSLHYAGRRERKLPEEQKNGWEDILVAMPPRPAVAERPSVRVSKETDGIVVVNAEGERISWGDLRHEKPRMRAGKLSAA